MRYIMTKFTSARYVGIRRGTREQLREQEAARRQAAMTFARKPRHARRELTEV